MWVRELWGCRICMEIITKRLITCSRWCWLGTPQLAKLNCLHALLGTNSVLIPRQPLGLSFRLKLSSLITRSSRLKYGTPLAKKGIHITFANKINICIFKFFGCLWCKWLNWINSWFQKSFVELYYFLGYAHGYDIVLHRKY